MKSYLTLFLAIFLVISSGAFATNYPHSNFQTVTSFPMDLDLTLQFDSAGGPDYCFSGDISANTEAAYDNITWLEDEPECEGAGRTKPTWAHLVGINTAAHQALNIYAAQRSSYYNESAVLTLQSDVSGLSDTVSLLGSPPQTFDDLTNGTTNKAFTETLLTKLNGISPGATVNSSDANLESRANHTGTQSADTITDGSSNKVFTDAMSTKLSGIATGATANSSDATLFARANHTGTQAESTVVNLTTDLSNRPIYYLGATQKSNVKVIEKHATVSSGTAVFYLTSDETISGSGLCTNIYDDSVNLFVNDATASYQMSYVVTNSNKTLTVTANKLGTANILTGILGQVAANTAVVRLQLKCD